MGEMIKNCDESGASMSFYLLPDMGNYLIYSIESALRPFDVQLKNRVSLFPQCLLHFAYSKQSVSFRPEKPINQDSEDSEDSGNAMRHACLRH